MSLGHDASADPTAAYPEHREAHEYHGHHDHDVVMPLEDNPIYQQDNVELRSVGIDVGSSGTQLTFSRLHLRRLGEDLTSRYHVIAREVLHQSPVTLTPYERGLRIDAAELGDIVGEAYEAAGMDPRSVDTGAVILTGEALRRENSERITNILAEHAGELVCASAGHHMEAQLAAHGSGATRRSYDEGLRILNLDIGGGTTKLSLIEHGQVVATAALQVGGRLQVVDGGRIRRLEPAGAKHAADAGYHWREGDEVGPADLDAVTELMADRLAAALTADPLSDEVRQLYVTEPLDALGDVDGVIVSGGVGEYVYGREDRDFGDLGRRLGAAVRCRFDSGAIPFPLLPAGECIRATVLGASQYSVQLSGNTVFVSDPENLLPRRNVQVVRPDYDLDDEVDADALACAIRSHLHAFDLTAMADVALALPWQGAPSHERLLAFAQAVVTALGPRVRASLPIVLVLDGDIAQTLGRLLRDELDVAGELLVIDGVRLGDFDFIDLGRRRTPSATVPVTIKSLLFDQEVSESSGMAPPGAA